LHHTLEQALSTAQFKTLKLALIAHAQQKDTFIDSLLWPWIQNELKNSFIYLNGPSSSPLVSKNPRFLFHLLNLVASLVMHKCNLEDVIQIAILYAHIVASLPSLGRHLCKLFQQNSTQLSIWVGWLLSSKDTHFSFLPLLLVAKSFLTAQNLETYLKQQLVSAISSKFLPDFKKLRVLSFLSNEEFFQKDLVADTLLKSLLRAPETVLPWLLFFLNQLSTATLSLQDFATLIGFLKSSDSNIQSLAQQCLKRYVSFGLPSERALAFFGEAQKLSHCLNPPQIAKF
jgi:hypothetical protein